MTHDLRLLDLAAKAAGRLWGQGVFDGNDLWNPLNDDGDALRLAVQCGLEVSLVDDEPDRAGRTTRACVGYYAGSGPTIRQGFVFEDRRGDIHSAVRRAIVRAAAAIGEQMP